MSAFDPKRTSEAALLFELSSADWQFKLKNRASGGAGRHPDPTIVAVDDRLTDRETHPHAKGFGREHRFENTIEVG